MIRRMEARDKGPVLGLIRATGFFTAAEVDVAEELIDVYLGTPDQKDYDVVVVEDEQGAPAGYMTWGPTPLAEDVYDLYWMAVAPSEQGKGRGKELVRWLEDEVGRRDGRMIIIETASQPKYQGTRQL
jgi:GNAT superfamily N-acetyltransferase